MKINTSFSGRAAAALFKTLMVVSMAAPLNTQAQDYPERPVKIVVGYPAGGGADSVARSVGNKLSERLGVPVVIENKSGASGMIAADMVAKSKPDGYTLLMMPADSHSIAPHVYQGIKYDALKDYTYLTLIGRQPMALIVQNSLPVENIHDFIKLAKEKGDSLTYASFGIGSSSHVAMAMLEQYGDFKMRHVPFQGSAPGLVAVMGGVVDAMMIPAPLAIPSAKEGKIKLLGIAAQHESSVAVGQPYFGTENIPIDASVWVGIMGPAGLPDAVAKKLNTELALAIKDEGLRTTLLNTGTEPNDGDNSIEFLGDYYQAEYKKWGEAVEASEITIEN